MNVCYTLICCFFLYDVRAVIITYLATEGETIRVKYSFRSYGSRMFCRGACAAGDVLIETEENEARNGRYSIKYEKPGDAEGDLTVTITHLSKSHSGTYHFGLGSDSSLYREFGILVTDALLDGSSGVKQLYKRSGGDLTLQCFFTNPKGSKYFCREECGETKNLLVKTSGYKERSGRYSVLYFTEHGGQGGYLLVTITQLISSDSGRYRCSVGEESHRDFEVIVTDDSTTTSPSSSSSFTRSPASRETTNQSEDQTPETTDDVSTEFHAYPSYEGETIRVKYSFRSYGSRKFCRGRCAAGDVLIETEANEARKGRYSIKYETTGDAEGDLTVTITHLRQSDSGAYHFGLGSNSSLYREFKILVTDALLNGSSGVKQLYKRSGGDLIVECFFPNPKENKYFCREKCGETKNVLIKTSGYKERSGRYSIEYFTEHGGQGGFLLVTITQLISSDSGRYRCSMGEESHRDFEVIVRDG